jgi:hypothetical protein
VLKIAATAELVELTVLRVGWVQLPQGAARRGGHVVIVVVDVRVYPRRVDADW